MYHGGGGFIHSDVYNMPVWLRIFHINKINEWLESQKKASEAKQQNNNPPSKNPMGPDINPSSTYNFKK